MTIEQAIQILDQAASQAPMDRKSHVMVQEALTIIKRALEPKEKKEEVKPTE